MGKNRNPGWCEIHLLGFSPNSHKLECTLHMQERANRHNCRFYEAKAKCLILEKATNCSMQLNWNIPTRNRKLTAHTEHGAVCVPRRPPRASGLREEGVLINAPWPWICSHLAPAAGVSSDGKLLHPTTIWTQGRLRSYLEPQGLRLGLVEF